MLTELPKPDGNGNGTTEITPDEGITLYGLVSDERGQPPRKASSSATGTASSPPTRRASTRSCADPSAKHVFKSGTVGLRNSRRRRTYGSYQGAYQAANSAHRAAARSPYRADFTLTKLTQSDTRFLLFGLGDPAARQQTTTSSGSARKTVPDVKKIKRRTTRSRPVGIALGDILGIGRRPDLHLDEARAAARRASPSSPPSATTTRARSTIRATPTATCSARAGPRPTAATCISSRWTTCLFTGSRTTPAASPTSRWRGSRRT